MAAAALAANPNEESSSINLAPAAWRALLRDGGGVLSAGQLAALRDVHAEQTHRYSLMMAQGGKTWSPPSK